MTIDTMDTKHANQVEYKITLWGEDSPEDPREWDNLAKLVFFHNRYDLPNELSLDRDDYDSWEEMGQDLIRNHDAAVILPVYMYDHSGLYLKVGSWQGFLPQGHAEFDSGQVGFAIVTRQAIRDNWNAKRVNKALVDRAEEVARAELKTYGQYLNGEVCGYTVSSVTTCKDCGQVVTETIDSCGGFYGTDPKENGMLDHIETEYAPLLEDAEWEY